MTEQEIKKIIELIDTGKLTIEQIKELIPGADEMLKPFKGVECMTSGDKNASTANCVVCADATPDAVRLEGSVDVKCDRCGKQIILSASSPKTPKKYCYNCAVSIVQDMNSNQQSFSS